MVTQVAACENCGRVREIHTLKPVETYKFIRKGGAEPVSYFDGTKMFCVSCRRNAGEVQP
jgi:hypothetical protein